MGRGRQKLDGKMDVAKDGSVDGRRKVGLMKGGIDAKRAERRTSGRVQRKRGRKCRMNEWPADSMYSRHTIVVVGEARMADGPAADADDGGGGGGGNVVFVVDVIVIVIAIVVVIVFSCDWLLLWWWLLLLLL